MNDFQVLRAPEKIPTDIEGLEHLVLSEFPEGRTTLVVGSSGSGKTILVIELLYRSIVQLDRPSVFVTFEERPQEIVRNVMRLGWDLGRLVEQGKLAFIDGSPEPEPVEVTGPFDLSGLFTQLRYAIQRIGAKLVVMDSIGALFAQFDSPGLVRQEIFRIIEMLRNAGVTSIITAERVDEYVPITRPEGDAPTMTAMATTMP